MLDAARRGGGRGRRGARRASCIAAHLGQVERFMAARACFRVLPIRYREAVADPAAAAPRWRRWSGVRSIRPRWPGRSTGRCTATAPRHCPEARDPARDCHDRRRPGVAADVTMRRMSTRVLLLLAVLAAAGAAAWLRPAPAPAPSTSAPPPAGALGGHRASARHRRLPRPGGRGGALGPAGGVLRRPCPARGAGRRRRGRGARRSATGRSGTWRGSTIAG